MRLCSRTTAKANQEVLKMVSEKLGRNQLKSFIKSFISHFDNRKKMNDLKGQLVSYINTFADFIRMLETVLEKSDLKPVFGAPDAPFRGQFIFEIKNRCKYIIVKFVIFWLKIYFQAFSKFGVTLFQNVRTSVAWSF